MKWYLLMYLYACGSGTPSNNPTILITPTCENREVRVEMPSIEACRLVRAVNNGSKCLTEDIEEDPQAKKTFNDRWLSVPSTLPNVQLLDK